MKKAKFKKLTAIILSVIMTFGVMTAVTMGASAADDTDLLGDVNMDGNIDISDVTMIKKFVAGETELTEEQQKYADVNQDGQVTLADATYIENVIKGVDPTETTTETEPMTTEPTTTEPETEEQYICFDAAKSGWDDVKKVYCHIYAADGFETTTNTGGSWLGWKVRKERCKYDENTGLYRYDLSNVDNIFSTDDGKIYCVIFVADSKSSDIELQTYDIVMSGSCIGDTVYCEGGLVENPVNSQETCYLAKWENNPDCGAVKVITSSGNVLGATNPDGITDADLFASYMVEYYGDTDKMANVQDVIDNEALLLVKDEVLEALNEELEDNDNKDEILAKITEILDGCEFPDIPEEPATGDTEPTETKTDTEPVTTKPTTTEPVTTPVTTEPITTEPAGTVKLGDVNEDGFIDISDATAVQKAVAKIVELADSQKLAANVNGDEGIDISDATMIQKFVAKIITEFAAAK